MIRRSDYRCGAGGRRDRAQLVLLAAAVAAAALVPMALAFHTLGAHPDVEAASAHDRPAEDELRALDRAVAGAARTAGDAARAGADREAVLATFDAALAPEIEGIETARSDEAVAIEVSRNESSAAVWAAERCPGGSNRAFGPCETVGGVVLQDRAGEPHVLAAGFDVTVTAPSGTARLSALVRVHTR